MAKWILFCTWIVLWLLLSAAAPWVLSDANEFLRNFVNHEFLGFMGVVVTITLASASNLYIEMRKLEDRVDAGVFANSKRDVRQAAYALLLAFVVAVILVVVKPLLGSGAHIQSVVNGAALTVILFSIITLSEITVASFSLDPRS